MPSLGAPASRSPQLAAAVDFLSALLTQLSEGQSETPGGIPTNLEFVTATQISPDGALNNVSCLAEAGAEYEVMCPPLNGQTQWFSSGA